MKSLKYEALRHNGNEFCIAEVELRERAKDGNTVWELSICGTAGDVCTKRQARWEAKRFLESYFDEGDAIREMNERCGTNYRTSKGAARYVVEQDGEYHGLDVVGEVGNIVLCAHSCGQIRDDLTKWFPELEQFFDWHLNTMKTANVIPTDVLVKLGCTLNAIGSVRSIGLLDVMPQPYAPKLPHGA